MQKVGNVTDTADQNGEFTNGNVAQGVQPTILDAAIFNTWQRELIGLVEGAGLVLDPSDFGQVLKAVKKIVTESSSDNLNSVYPIGIVAWFAQNRNPNTIFHGQTWSYIGENKTIRLGKQDGSDIFSSGGSDTVTLIKNNLPNVQINVSGSTGATDLGTKQTEWAGGHGHAGKFVESNTSLDGGGSDRRSWSVNYPSNGESLITPVNDHSHSIIMGQHGHTVEGKTDSLGIGSGINITNSYITLMGWYRSA